MNKSKWQFFVFYYVAIILATVVANEISPQWLIIYFGIVAIIIGITIQRIESSIKEKINEYKDSITNVEYLYEDQFYAKLKALIKNSNTNVDLSHMSLKRPSYKKGSLQESYYKSLKELTNKSCAHIRRVERFSKEKIGWIEGLLHDFNGIKNFSLFIYCEPSEELQKSELSTLLSIQRVDEDNLFIVALNEHTSIRAPRDIYFRSKRLTDYFLTYYQSRVIVNSKCILDCGQINQEMWESIKDNA